MVGAEHTELIEAILLTLAEKPIRDREVILRVTRDLIAAFPPLALDPRR